MSSTSRGNLCLIEETGDIFSAPPNSVLIHACNCQGSWGAGIAEEFKKRYPGAYKEYAAHCKKNMAEDLIGTCFLIPPLEPEDEWRPKHYIGCLFTSRRYGRSKDNADAILEATTAAMQALLNHLKKWHAKPASTHGTGQPGAPAELFMCRINSGKFGVPWARSKAVLENLEIDGTEDIVNQIKVILKG
ncbi:hypothetical protein M433DRAFT_4314 [Acidomyces richmondensis BFW]|nr:MAG: hypothetical protein FE78DRAFT_27711 [Acidomyces sp. 'richmondensis']KYG45746.1 hypothetical protein M433DRAFT_4314 [Acidomyces richmondensis BFW]